MKATRYETITPTEELPTTNGKRSVGRVAAIMVVCCAMAAAVGYMSTVTHSAPEVADVADREGPGAEYDERKKAVFHLGRMLGLPVEKEPGLRKIVIIACGLVGGPVEGPCPGPEQDCCAAPPKDEGEDMMKKVKALVVKIEKFLRPKVENIKTQLEHMTDVNFEGGMRRVIAEAHEAIGMRPPPPPPQGPPLSKQVEWLEAQIAMKRRVDGTIKRLGEIEPGACKSEWAFGCILDAGFEKTGVSPPDVDDRKKVDMLNEKLNIQDNVLATINFFGPVPGVDKCRPWAFECLLDKVRLKLFFMRKKTPTPPREKTLPGLFKEVIAMAPPMKQMLDDVGKLRMQIGICPPAKGGPAPWDFYTAIKMAYSKAGLGGKVGALSPKTRVGDLIKPLVMSPQFKMAMQRVRAKPPPCLAA